VIDGFDLLISAAYFFVQFYSAAILAEKRTDIALELSMLTSDVRVHAVEDVYFADGTLVVKTFLLCHSVLVKQSIAGKLLLAVGALMYHFCSLFQMLLKIFFRRKLCLAGVAFVGNVSGWLLKRLRWVRLVPMAIEKGFSGK
jgi:hypothetical protein